MYLQNKNRLTDIENKLIVTKGKKVEKDKRLGSTDTDTNYYT